MSKGLAIALFILFVLIGVLMLVFIYCCCNVSTQDEKTEELQHDPELENFIQQREEILKDGQDDRYME